MNVDVLHPYSYIYQNELKTDAATSYVVVLAPAQGDLMLDTEAGCTDI
jgi:hypothetical protein